MMIKIISFDIGGTLLINDNNDKNNNYGLKELTDLLNLPYENVRNSYKKIFQTKKGSLNELIDIFCKELGIKHNQKLNEFFYNKFNQSQRGTISSENILLINTLKNEGYKIILFSNSCCLLNNDAINDIVDCIDDIFYSYDIGYTKDDEESYKYIEEKLNVKPSEILHIGDTLKSDYYMPKRNGWNVLYYGKVDDTNKPNLLKQEFKAKHLREKLVSDITYIYTKELGWTYLAIVMDLYSLSVIGYSYGKNMDADLVIKAIENARKKGKFRKKAIFHSDLGSQYTSNKVEEYLRELNLRHSYSKKGYPYDNASMESFNAILKKEEVNLHEYETFEEAKLAIFEFIEGWYNRKRIHSSIGYKVPCELESEVA